MADMVNRAKMAGMADTANTAQIAENTQMSESDTTDDSLTTSWLWQAGDGVNGLKINRERGLLEWYDSLGCACGDSSAVQSYEEFFRQGPTFSSMPDDVKAEVEATLTALSAGEPTTRH